MVTIESNPPGAGVYFDGKELGLQGNTPLRMRLAAGTHKLILELNGYVTIEQMIKVSQAQRFTFMLNPAPARLDVKAPATNDAASGGDLFIDGERRGTIPMTLDVPAGKHLVEAKKAGHAPFTQEVDVRAGELRPVWVSLQGGVVAPNGSLRVVCDAAGADVLLDGQLRGHAPLLIADLAPGDHLLVIRGGGPEGRVWRKTVHVVVGEIARVDATLTPVAPAAATVDFYPGRMKDAYRISSGTQACETPCKLTLAPGSTLIGVTGPRAFQQTIDVPAGPSRVEVEHWRLSNVIAGSILAAVGIGLIPAGSVVTYNGVTGYYIDETKQVAGGSVLLAVGVSSLIVGIQQLATIRHNRLVPTR
jgi:hypothetical protein